MRLNLKARVLRVAEGIKILNYYTDLVKEMADFSDKWNASAAAMTKSLETRNVETLSRSILENRKAAESLNFVLQRHERIVAKLGENK